MKAGFSQTAVAKQINVRLRGRKKCGGKSFTDKRENDSLDKFWSKVHSVTCRDAPVNPFLYWPYQSSDRNFRAQCRTWELLSL